MEKTKHARIVRCMQEQTRENISKLKFSTQTFIFKADFHMATDSAARWGVNHDFNEQINLCLKDEKHLIDWENYLGLKEEQ